MTISIIKKMIYQNNKKSQLAWILIISSFLTFWIIFITLFNPPSKDKSLSPTDLPPHWDPQMPKSRIYSRILQKNYNEIPNICHFVRQIGRDKRRNTFNMPLSPFKVEFRHLLSYYSCHHYLKPEKIYFWTDTPKEMLKEAKMNGDIFTKAFFHLPNLEIRFTEFPNITKKGIPITHYAHRSDFVRARVMAKMGGIYLDDDAWILRDLSPLRKTGFENVFSLDKDERIAQAAFLCKPFNPLMIAFAELQEEYFTGEWLRASNDLITGLMIHFSRFDNQKVSLTLEKDAFFPGYWYLDGLQKYYEVHEKDEINDLNEPKDLIIGNDFLKSFNLDKDWEWRMDWRRSYIVHGFSNAFRKQKADWMFKEFKSFTPAYILSKRSNIARALYPTLQFMIDEKFIELNIKDLKPPLASSNQTVID